MLSSVFIYIYLYVYSLTAIQTGVCMCLSCTNHYCVADILRGLDHQLDASWRVFGTFLDVDYGTMNSIDTDQRGKSGLCMLDLVSKWATHHVGTGDLPRT